MFESFSDDFQLEAEFFRTLKVKPTRSKNTQVCWILDFKTFQILDFGYEIILIFKGTFKETGLDNIRMPSWKKTGEH